MSNGQRNCILGVCCPPRSAEQKHALADQIMKKFPQTPEDAAYPLADWILENFDLAPAGSLDAFKAEVAKLARENP